MKHGLRLGLIFLIICLMVFFGAALVFRMTGLRFCHVDGESMRPAIAADATLLLNPKTTIRQGDIVVFSQNGGYFVKRVIGLPGDRVRMEVGQLFVNDYPLAEPYLEDARIQKFRTESFSVTVPNGEYFVLGDNRDHSLDSRSFGTVRASQILGVAIWAV